MRRAGDVYTRFNERESNPKITQRNEENRIRRNGFQASNSQRLVKEFQNMEKQFETRSVKNLYEVESTLNFLNRLRPHVDFTLKMEQDAQLTF